MQHIMVHDDQVDASSYLGLMLDMFIEGNTTAEQKQEDREEELEEMGIEEHGRSNLTGY